ncbi:MAG: hypothetical protein V4510_02920 [bacterium]
MHITLREATWFLVILAAAVVGLTAYEVASGAPMPLAMWVPAILMVCVLAAWPFLNGWRPLASPQQQLRDCPRCGAQWRPSDEEGATRCPACAEAV